VTASGEICRPSAGKSKRPLTSEPSVLRLAQVPEGTTGSKPHRISWSSHACCSWIEPSAHQLRPQAEAPCWPSLYVANTSRQNSAIPGAPYICGSLVHPCGSNRS
jgi:hypothetical protein